MAASLSANVKQFRALAGVVKSADDDLRKELFKAVSAATRPVKQEIPESARRTLPHKGGLNEWVASAKVTTRQAYSGRNPGITIKAEKSKTVRVSTLGRGVQGPLRPGQKKTTTQRRKGTFGAKSDLPAIDRGRVMHPVFGRGPLVGPQMVRKGFFTDVMRGVVARRAQKEIVAALERLKKQTEERIRRAS